jgi:hypothetical protein
MTRCGPLMSLTTRRRSRAQVLNRLNKVDADLLLLKLMVGFTLAATLTDPVEAVPCFDQRNTA